MSSSETSIHFMNILYEFLVPCKDSDYGLCGSLANMYLTVLCVGSVFVRVRSLNGNTFFIGLRVFVYRALINGR